MRMCKCDRCGKEVMADYANAIAIERPHLPPEENVTIKLCDSCLRKFEEFVMELGRFTGERVL